MVLTGGKHRSLGRPEADAMLEAWSGPATAVVRESAALTTAENASHAAAVALALGAPEVMVVTSRWHSPRAVLLFRLALRGTGVRVTPAPARTPWSPTLLMRELVCVAAVPFQLRRAGRRAGRVAFADSTPGFAASDSVHVGQSHASGPHTVGAAPVHEPEASA